MMLLDFFVVDSSPCNLVLIGTMQSCAVIGVGRRAPANGAPGSDINNVAIRGVANTRPYFLEENDNLRVRLLCLLKT